MFSRTFRTTIASAALALLCGGASAQSITFSGADYTSSSLGADFPTAYDIFSFTSLPGGPLDVSSPVSADIGQLSFVVGVNCTTCALTPWFDTPIDFTVNGITQQIDLHYGWSSTGPVDTLTFSSPSAMTFDLGSSGTLNVSFNTVSALSSSGGTVSENLSANFAVTPVPEPSTYALMLAGMGIVCFVARRRA